MARSEHPLVSVMLANNETGVIQPIRVIADIVHAAGGLLHVDAVQGAGRIDCRIGDLGADLMSLSAHKLGGPQGVGALIVRGDIHIAEPLIKGGGQERGIARGNRECGGYRRVRRRGRGLPQVRRTLRAWRIARSTRKRLKAAMPQAVIFGQNAPRLPNTTLFAVPGLKAETAIIAFDLNGIAVSSGSACSSGKVQASHVLAAMGVEPALAQARCA